MLVEAVFDSIEVLGFREMTLRLTPEAIAHGFDQAIPERPDLTVGYGRGERSQTSTTDLNVPDCWRLRVALIRPAGVRKAAG